MSGSQESQPLPSVRNATAPTGTEKKCSKCGEIKPLTEFSKNRRNKDGLSSKCKECADAYNKIYRTIHAEEAKIRTRLWYTDNKEKAVADAREYRKKNAPIISERNKARYDPVKAKENNQRYYAKNSQKSIQYSHEWRRKNPEKGKAARKKWNDENTEKVRVFRAQWRADNIDKVRAYLREADRRRRKIPSVRLSRNISRAIAHSLDGNKNGRHWEDLVGYNIDQLKKHLEKKFLKGMTWENHGKVWHIDHIIPIMAFNFSDPKDIDFQKCWCLKNLRPLWAVENMSKGARIPKPFQPSLAIAL
jgi:hypothetical protein